MSVMTEIVAWQPIALRLFLNPPTAADTANRLGCARHCWFVSQRRSRCCRPICSWARRAGRQIPSLSSTWMRLPLGILTGVGFIGAGAIFRQSDMLRGVTTAATVIATPEGPAADDIRAKLAQAFGSPSSAKLALIPGIVTTTPCAAACAGAALVLHGDRAPLRWRADWSRHRRHGHWRWRAVGPGGP